MLTLRQIRFSAALIALLAVLLIQGCDEKKPDGSASPAPGAGRAATAPGAPPPNITTGPPGSVPANAPPEIRARAMQGQGGGPPPR
jgi:hypothetical protein